MQGSSPNIEKETILGYMFDNTALVLLEEQSIVGNSSLVFPDSKRDAAIRDLAMLSLLKSGHIDTRALMREVNCNFEVLGPILDTLASFDKTTKEYSFKTMKDSTIDQEAVPTF